MAECIDCENINCLIKKNTTDPNIKHFLKNKHTIKCTLTLEKRKFIMFKKTRTHVRKS